MIDIFKTCGHNIDCRQDTPPTLTVFQIITFIIGEIIGTALLLIIGCMGCVTSMQKDPVSLLQIALTFGFAVMICINVFAHTSGGHINPIVTLTAYIMGNIKLYVFFIYLVAQVVGATLGFALVKLLTPGKYFDVKHGKYSLCTTAPNADLHVMQALMVEFVITFVLALLCCSVWDPRNKNHHDGVSIKFGLAIAGLAIAGAPYSGGSMNPARSLGPAIVNNEWDSHWIYWVGPLSGAAFAGILYRLFYFQPKTPVEE